MSYFSKVALRPNLVMNVYEYANENSYLSSSAGMNVIKSTNENIENTVMQDLMVAWARMMLHMLGCYHVLFELKLNIRDSN